MSDDMGFSDIGCYGSEIRTPNLDHLAANGLRFSQFYNGARCCPTRASLMTGLYPHQTGIGHMTYGSHPAGTNPNGYANILNEHCLTIAEVLKPAGYRTYGVGKWHIAANDEPDQNVRNWPMQRGFEKFYGTITGAGSFYDPALLARGNTLITPLTDPEYKPSGTYYYTEAISDNAIRFILDHRKESPDKPFFMYVAYTAAHWPMQAPEKDIAKYKGQYDGGYGPIREARFKKLKTLGLVDPKWKLSPQEGNWDGQQNKEWEARCMEVYAAMIDNMDQGIGRIVATLEQNGQLDNTLIMFLQDNGGCDEGLGRSANKSWELDGVKPMGPDELQTRVWPPMRTRDGRPFQCGPETMPGPDGTFVAYGRNWANVSNTPFREYKHYIHEGGISTPFIAHWPKQIAAKGKITPQVGHIIDVMATCVDIASAAYPEQVKGESIHPLEGASLLPVFKDETLAPRMLYWEHEGNRAIRDGQWKLVSKGAQSPWELYDLEADRTEMNDLSAQYPERVRQMEARWMTYAERTDVFPWPWGGYGSTVEVSAGMVLDNKQSPHVEDRSFRIKVDISGQQMEGVLVAQGGNRFGYAFYCKEGRVVFAVRTAQDRLYEISAPLPDGDAWISSVLLKDGTMQLMVNGKLAASGSAELIPAQPVGGLSCGRGGQDPVGGYAAPFVFNGTIKAASIDLL